jgi:sodium transport system ATP-binding protein
MIFDEPTAGLDVIAARGVLALIDDLKRQGRTIIYSTHIMTEAERICDEVAIIERGEILAHGSIEAIRDRAPSRSVEDVFVEVVTSAGGINGDR